VSLLPSGGSYPRLTLIACPLIAGSRERSSAGRI